MSGKKRTCLLQIVNLNSYRNEPNTVGKLLIILRAEKKIKSKETEKILGNTDTYWLWQGFPKSFIIFEGKNEAKLSYEKWEAKPYRIYKENTRFEKSML